ncbi:toxin-antitoxin system HicB family antitoxin [Micromonospora sp. WMMD729]|uniref:toxin-antitoxin system HicB family antitoxin n=1 Tax=Micromonospora sp. WMMD729 TaxID=3404127 RepID=UPI003BF4773F
MSSRPGLSGAAAGRRTQQGEQVPPFAERSYSGKFNLRVGESLHRELAITLPRTA